MQSYFMFHFFSGEKKKKERKVFIPILHYHEILSKSADLHSHWHRNMAEVNCKLYMQE